jgi:hypothetical protein
LKTTHTHRLALTPPILPAVSPRASQRSTLQTAADSMLENNVKTKTLKVCCWENDGFLEMFRLTNLLNLDEFSNLGPGRTHFHNESILVEFQK